MEKPVLILVVAILVVGLVLGSCAAPAPVPVPAPATAPAAAPVPVPAPAPAPAKPLELKFSEAGPISRLTRGVFYPWAKEIEELSNGRVKVTVYSGGALGPISEHYNLAVTRTADIAAMDPCTTPGVFPRAEAITLPLFWDSNEVPSMVFWDLMQKYMVDTEFKNVKVLWVHIVGVYQIFTRTEPVKTFEDFKGMKIGVFAPILVEIVKASGGAPVFIFPADTYTALERGLLDGFLFGWDGGVAFRIPEVTKYRTGNVGISLSPYIEVMNLDTWNSLPSDIQKIIDEKGPEWSRWAGATLDKIDLTAIQDFADYDKKVGNPPIYYLPESEKARWKQTVQPLIDAWIKEKEAKGMPGKAMVADLYALTEKYSK